MGYIQKSFVHTYRLYQIGIPRKYGMQSRRHPLIYPHAKRYEDQIRAQLPGSERRHGGMHSEFPGFVTRRSYHSSGMRGTDNHRFPSKPGIIPLLHGCIKSIHIYMYYLSVIIHREIHRNCKNTNKTRNGKEYLRKKGFLR